MAPAADQVGTALAYGATATNTSGTSPKKKAKLVVVRP
jgi:hypothetical protein